MKKQHNELAAQEPVIASAPKSVPDDVCDMIEKSAAASGLQLSRLSYLDTLALSKKKCREITPQTKGASGLAQSAQGALLVLAQAQAVQEAAQQTVRQIAKDGPLFRATVDPETLMKLGANKDLVGSTVMGPKGFVAQAGFQAVELEAPDARAVDAVTSATNAPLIIAGAMQAMAALSGQYYMHEISSQLKMMGEQLDKLISFHHDEKIGVLHSISDTIAELTQKQNPDSGDLTQIQSAKAEAKKVFGEYLVRLGKIDPADIAEDKKLYFSKAEIQSLKKRLDDSEVLFTMRICFQASMLVEKCKAAEIALRMRMHGFDARTDEDLCSLVKGMDSTFHGSIKEQWQEYLEPILEQSREYAVGGIDRLLEEVAQSGITGMRSALRNALAAAEEGEAVKKLKIADTVKQWREALDEDIAEAQQKPPKAPDSSIEQLLQSLSEEFTQQSEESRAMVTGLGQFFSTPRTILYMPGENLGEERVFEVLDK